MKHEIDLKNYQLHTDLVIDQLDTISGMSFEKKEYDENEIHVTDIVINEESSQTIEKKPGKYITINFKDVTDQTNQKNLIQVVTKELKKLLDFIGIKETDRCFIAGLGNIKSTPDSLGPKVIEQVAVTKYIFDAKGIEVEDGVRNVSAFVPGVMGITGIESGDVIMGIVNQIKPDFMIVIDALASFSIDRVNRTIQMTDTGIHPGSGIGNSRKEISKEKIGIPVIAIGIPTVVDAVTIVSDAIRYFMKQVSYNKDNYHRGKHKLTPVTNRNYLDHQENLSKEEKTELLGMVGTLSEEEIKTLIFEVLTPIGYNMMVTPKEVDFVIDSLSRVISSSINRSLHRKDMSH